MTQLDPAQAGSLITKFLSAADKANATLNNIEQLSANGRNLLTVNQESIDAMIGNLRETSEHLRAASREIRRNPWRLLYQPSKNELKQEGLADAARSFSDAAGKLDAAFTRLEAHVKAAGPSLPAADAQLKELQEHLGAALKNLSETEAKFWEILGQQR
jgi:chromosome segregation ATPase